MLRISQTRLSSNSFQRVRFLLWCEFLFINSLLQIGVDALDRTVQEIFGNIVENDAASGKSGDVCYACTHRARADNADVVHIKKILTGND